MRQGRDELIQRLVADAQPVLRPPSPALAAGIWWAGTWAFALVALLLAGEFRPGALGQLAGQPRFLLESLAGLAASALLAGFAFGDAVPGRARPALLAAGLVLGAAWVLAYVIGLESPALVPGMLGKRPECFLETLLYSLPPALAGWWFSRRYYVLLPLRNAVVLTLAAAMVPALAMQFACMYEPAHILTHHILPIPLVVATAALLQAAVLAWRR
jgi:hypothetical protein